MLRAGNHPTQAIRLVMLIAIVSATTIVVHAQSTPSLVDSNLRVRTVVENLDQPTSTAFLGPNEFLVLEKATGQVKRVVNGVVQSTVLDLAVNSGSERGLLGIALHPNFPATPQVYLYWTESTTGADTTVLSETPLLGNRVDRFVWDGSTLTFDRNIIRLRALQPPFAAEPTPAAGRGNHDGGVIKFGPDGKLYIFIGDVGRRGWMQNLLNGPLRAGSVRPTTTSAGRSRTTPTSPASSSASTTTAPRRPTTPSPRSGTCSWRGSRAARRCRRTPRRPRATRRSSWTGR